MPGVSNVGQIVIRQMIRLACYNCRVPSGQGKPRKPGKRLIFRKSQGKPGKVREFL